MYLCYGMHTMLNVVADKEGEGACVLIRACAPMAGNLNIFSFKCMCDTCIDSAFVWHSEISRRLG